MSHLGAIERLERNAARAAEIAGVMVRYGLADWLRRIPASRVQEWLRDAQGKAIPDLTVAERARLALTELGTTFIKFGQTLSTRPDLVGQEMAHELGRLQSGTPADPPGAAQAMVEAELGRRPEDLFAQFEAEPFASASIAQVHHARLRSGEDVVVKIAKTGIERRIEADLGILADLAELAHRHVPDLRPYRPVAVVRQFARTLRAELDFTRERHNMDEFRHNFAGDDTVHFAQPWPQLSSRRVLTMECLRGIMVSESDELRAHCTDIDAFARRGANMYLEMIFRDGFYHADPHPGNLMLLPGEVVGVLDCGMVQRLDEDLREAIERLLLAVSQGDPEAMADGVWNLGATPPAGSRDELRSELADLVGEYKGRSIGEMQLSAVLKGLFDVAHRNHLFLPPGVSLLLRTLVELEGTARLLNPSFNLAEIVRPYLQKATARRFSPRHVARHLQRGFREWDRLVEGLPRYLNEMLQRMRAGTFSVHLEHRRLDPVANRLVLGVLVSSLILGSSLLWSMRAPPLVWDVPLLGLVGYALSIWLGWRLFRAIRRSEDERDEEGS